MILNKYSIYDGTHYIFNKQYVYQEKNKKNGKKKKHDYIFY